MVAAKTMSRSHAQWFLFVTSVSAFLGWSDAVAQRWSAEQNCLNMNKCFVPALRLHARAVGKMIQVAAKFGKTGQNGKCNKWQKAAVHQDHFMFPKGLLPNAPKWHGEIPRAGGTSRLSAGSIASC